jgi:hypothetical protein
LAEKTIAKIVDITKLNEKKNPVPEPDPQLRKEAKKKRKKKSS